MSLFSVRVLRLTPETVIFYRVCVCALLSAAAVEVVSSAACAARLNKAADTLAASHVLRMVMFFFQKVKVKKRLGVLKQKAQNYTLLWLIIDNDS